jgi:hypothetical protein
MSPGGEESPEITDVTGLYGAILLAFFFEIAYKY